MRLGLLIVLCGALALTQPALAQQQADVEVARPATEDLRTRFPAVYEAVWSVLTVDHTTKEAAIAALETAVAIASSPKAQETVFSAFALDGKAVLAALMSDPGAVARTTLDRTVSNVAEGAAISVGASLVVDTIFASRPLSELPPEWQMPLRALFNASLVEFGGVARASADPSALVAPLVNRALDIHAIYKSTGALVRVQDSALTAMALSIESAAQLGGHNSSDRARAIASDIMRQASASIPDIVGRDDATAVSEIVNLTFVALMSQNRGDIDRAQSLANQILSIGRASGNIHPFSAITKPIDWLTAIGRTGFRDAPEQAAVIMISATGLRGLFSSEAESTDAAEIAAERSPERKRSAEADGTILPVTGFEGNFSALFYDPLYPRLDPPAQHLGVDLPAGVGSTVVSPVTGVVIHNNTATDEAFNKYLVIRDPISQLEHVLGHIDSSLVAGTAVTQGQAVGTIVRAGTGPHVHWGVNSKSVLAAIDVPARWGFGRGPFNSTTQDAAARGWLDPLSVLPAEGLAAADLSDAEIASQSRSQPVNEELILSNAAGDVFDCRLEALPWRECWMREGATSAILQLGSMLEAEAATPPGPGVLYKFYDLGNVDVAHVDFPYGLQAGTPIEYFPMVNGVQDFVWPQPLFQREAESGNVDDAVFQNIRKRYGGLTSLMDPAFIGYRDLPDGRQRFVYSHSLDRPTVPRSTVASAYGHFDFLEGRLTAVAVRGSVERTPVPGSIAEVQRELARRGYEPGPVDGQMGPATRNAVRDFQAEHCLETNGEINARTRELITAEAGYFLSGRAMPVVQPCGPNIRQGEIAAQDFLEGGGAAEPEKAVTSESLSFVVSQELFQKLAICAGLHSSWEDCYQAAGVTQEAIGFTRSATAILGQEGPGAGAVAIDFVDLGPLGLAYLDLPGAGNWSPTDAVVRHANGQLVWPADGWSGLELGEVRSAVSRLGFDVRYGPVEGAGSLFFRGYRAPPNGGHRFVFGAPLRAGCQACLVADVLYALDFDGDGRLESDGYFGILDYRGHSNRDDMPSTIFQQDLALTQGMLASLGYEVELPDGVSGQRTEAALHAFQSEYCLPVTGKIDAATALALASSKGFAPACRGATPDNMSAVQGVPGLPIPANSQIPGPEVLARFSQACTAAGDDTGGLPCPYPREHACEGSGCWIDGRRQAVERTQLFAAPGVPEIVGELRPGEIALAETSTVFLVPCRARVPQDMPESWQGSYFYAPALTRGQTAYRMEDAGEGTFRFLVDGQIAWPSLDIEIVATCPYQAETWVRLRLRNGTVGWTDKTYDLRDSSRHIEPVDAAADPEGFAALPVNRRSLGDGCSEPRPPLDRDGLVSLIAGRTLGGVTASGTFWTETLGRGADLAAGGRAETVFQRRGGGPVPGLYRFGEDRICFTYGTLTEWSCKQVQPCTMDRAAYALVDPETGTASSLILDVLANEPSERASSTEAARDTRSFGEHTVLEPLDWIAIRQCKDESVGDRSKWSDCLRRLGADYSALALSERLNDEVIATRFWDFGRVDVIEVHNPFLANTNDYPLFVNGTPDVIPVPFVEIERFTDSASRALLRRYPAAMLHGALSGPFHRALSDGTQRLVFATPVTDGCRACDVLGSALVAYEFDAEGRQIGVAPIGLVGDGRWAEITTEDELAAKLMRDLKALQVRLNLHGYEAGTMDGVPGPRTEAALRAFQSENCLGVTGAIDLATAQALAKNENMQTCSPGNRQDATVAVGLPGRYLEEPEFRLKPGESTFGVEALADGSARFAGKTLFPASHYEVTDWSTINITRDYTGRFALIVQRDWDQGGLRGAVVDLAQGIVLVPNLIPEDRVGGIGHDENVRVIVDASLWSPDGRYVVYPLLPNQDTVKLGVVDLLTGEHVATGPENAPWYFPDLAAALWTEDVTFKVPFRESECEQDCGHTIDFSFALSGRFPEGSENPSNPGIGDFGIEDLADSPARLAGDTTLPDARYDTDPVALPKSCNLVAESCSALIFDTVVSALEALEDENLVVLLLSPNRYLMTPEAADMVDGLGELVAGGIGDALAREGIQRLSAEVATDFAASIAAHMAVQRLADHYEAQGNAEAAASLRLLAIPAFEMVKLGWASSAGTLTPTGLVVTNAAIWTKNVIAAGQLVIGLDQAARRGTDLDTTILQLKEMNESAHATLRAERLTGALFTIDQQGEPLNDRMRTLIWEILLENERILREAVEVRETGAGRINAFITGLTAKVGNALAPY